MSEQKVTSIINAQNLMVNNSPHIQSSTTIKSIMWEVCLALIPALIMGIYNFGLRALLTVVICILGAVCSEYLIQKFLRKIPTTISDGSAVLTGLLLGLCLPVYTPFWISFAGGIIAISLGKQVFGGLGQNIFNPAHVARAILLISWPAYLTTWIKTGFTTDIFAVDAVSKSSTLFSIDAITTATPLGLLKETAKSGQTMGCLMEQSNSIIDFVMKNLNLTFSDLFLGLKLSGSIGETSKLALLIGAIFLLIRKHISWHAPVTMVITVFVGAFCYSRNLDYAMFHLLTGGLFLGAIFMATDMVTSPITPRGKVIFGLGCGLLTLLIRLFGSYPEGVCFSILIMNAFVPLIDKFCRKQPFGSVKAKPQKEEASK